MIDIITAVIALDSTAQVSSHGGELTWHDGNPNGITAQQITEKQAELVVQAESDATAKAGRLVSVKSKLEALGLTTDEVKDAFGL